MRVYLVNAFTYRGSGGNGAGVTICEKFPPSDAMQQVAKQVGLSETVFISPRREGFSGRFFTPECEVPVCGHATIAAFYLAGGLGLVRGKDGNAKVMLETKAGKLPVYISFRRGRVDKVYMGQAEPRALGVVGGEDLRHLCSCLGLESGQVGIPGLEEAVPEMISTGLPDIIVPVLTRKALDSMEPDFPGLAELSRRLGVVGVHAFTLERGTARFDVRCRNFGTAVGINEEAATGTSNGALGYYLLKRGLITEGEIVCKQGAGMGKPSAIYVKVGPEGIKVGGKVLVIGERHVTISTGPTRRPAVREETGL